MGKKKQRQGHYCKICGEHKSNEKFTGKRHAKHVCKSCASLPQERKNELQRITRLDKIAVKYPRSKDDWNLLEKYSKDNKYPEAKEFAQMILGINSGQDQDIEDIDDWDEDMDDLFFEIPPSPFSEVDEDLKNELSFDIYEVVEDFILRKGYIPELKDKLKIVDEICSDLSLGFGYDIIPDDELGNLFDTILKDIVDRLEKEGIKPVSYYESLLVMETERLQLRKFVKDDLTEFHSFMQKPEVTYAWEHAFTKTDTRKWLNKQLSRYRKDGYGCYAVILKETGKMIGMAGLMKSDIEGKEVVELGYIFDNAYWGQGYCIEAVKGCVNYAFHHLKLDKLYCSIRPNNLASIRIAEKIGMIRVGEHIVIYCDKEMPHSIYVLENSGLRI